MTDQEVADCNRERLARWERSLNTNHATPAVLLGIGHDEAGGAVHVLMPEDLPAQFALEFLRLAELQIKAELLKRS